MNGEMLFKAKCADNGEWVEGFYFCMVHDDGRHMHHFIMPIGADLSLGTPIENIQVEVTPETLCRCTGLCDKIGKKLFEKDIIEIDGVVGIVKFGNYDNGFHYGFYIEWINFHHYRPEFAFWNTRVTRLGNIFDDQDLI